MQYGKDPAPSALLASGTTRAPYRELRKLGGGGSTDTPPANLPCEVWEPKDCSANQSPRNLVPRRAGIRGALCVLAHPAQAGYPAPMDTDASLGYAVTAYQSAPLELQLATLAVLRVRIEGRRLEGIKPQKRNLLEDRKRAIALTAPSPRTWRPRPRTNWGSFATWRLAGCSCGRASSWSPICGPSVQPG